MVSEIKKSIKKKIVKNKSNWYFVLDGKIFFEERIGKKLICSSDIDGKVVLQILVNAFSEGFKQMKENHISLNDILSKEIKAKANNKESVKPNNKTKQLKNANYK